MWISQGEMKAGHEEMKAMSGACIEKMEKNPEEMKSVMNRPQWILSEYGKTDMGTST
jgi:hypothetical protein